MKKTINKEFEIFTFRAIDEPEICKQYSTNHLLRLNDYGIKNVTSNSNQWNNNPFVYCTVAINSKTKELVGGVRLQISDGRGALPMELAIGHLNTAFTNKIKHQIFKGNVCESCGLWTAENVKGMGISRYLMRASIASTSQLGVHKIFGICGENTLQFFSEIGFEIDRNLGEHGNISYPTKNHICYILEIKDVKGLASALKDDKKAMLFLRKNPISNKIENYKSHEIYIQYDLTYNNITKSQPITKNLMEMIVI